MYKLLAKKNINNTSWKHYDKTSNKDKDKAKFHNSSFANQPQIRASKKDKCGCRESHPVTRVNVTRVTKKDKDKAKNLNHVKYYTYK